MSGGAEEEKGPATFRIVVVNAETGQPIYDKMAQSYLVFAGDAIGLKYSFSGVGLPPALAEGVEVLRTVFVSGPMLKNLGIIPKSRLVIPGFPGGPDGPPAGG